MSGAIVTRAEPRGWSPTVEQCLGPGGRASVGIHEVAQIGNHVCNVDHLEQNACDLKLCFVGVCCARLGDFWLLLVKC